jgi:hypothetical protein
MNTLRNSLIRLAQQKPELREHLVPLLRSAAIKTWDSGFTDTPVAGDRRYQHVPFHKLTPVGQNQARGQYPHKSVGAAYDFLDEHYLYPVKQDGSLASARRNLAIPLAKIKNRQYMEGLGYTLNPGWEGRVASDNRWERSIAASCMPRQAGCEKLPEGGMRDNCEKKVEDGKGKTANNLERTSALLTTTLTKRPDLDVLAKMYKGDLVAVTYSNRAQAYKKAEELGEGWDVYHWGVPFYLGREKDGKGKTAANTDWLDDVLKDLSKDYTATRSAFKPVNYARVNGKPITDIMIKGLKDAIQEDLQEIKENGYATNGHKAGRALFDKIQAWSKTLKPSKTASVPDQHQLRILKDTVKNPLKGKFLGGPSAEEAEETLRKKFKYTDKQIEDLKKDGKGKTASTRQAGYSFAEDTAWFAFVGNKTPFNVDVIEKINYTAITFRDDDGKVQEDLGMRVNQPISYSPSLTRGLEMAGAVREVVFAVKYPRGALRQVQAALTTIGKVLKFQVEYLPSPRKAQTRQKAR